MNIKLIASLIFLLVVTINLRAQKKETNNQEKVKFETTGQIGIMEGENGTSFELQMINGIKHKTFSAGIGLALDYYVMRSIPLFFALRKDLVNKSQSPFIYTNGGINFPWVRESYSWISDTDPGVFYDLGLGYRFALNSNSILLSAGYSLKTFSQDESYPIYCLVGPCPEQVNHFSYKLRRLSIKAGFSF